MTDDVRCPGSLDGLWPLLDDGYAVMAGGTDLLARRGAHAPPGIACLERIESLRGVREQDGYLRIGACETHARLLGHPLVAARLPALSRSLSVLGSPLVRNMGTIGGNAVTASPAGDALPPLYALDALAEVSSKNGTRRLPLADFILGPGRTALKRGEIVSAVLVPPVAEGAVQHFEKVGLRNALAISVVSLAAVVERDAAGSVTRARLALGSVAPTVVRCARAEAMLEGRRLDRDALLAAGETLRGEISPIDDLRATAAYRREVAGRLLLRLSLY
jgi:xanthine dehydrogenase FAD-binding subunit